MDYLVKGRALKNKMHSVYGQILFDRKLTNAWEKVAKNKGAGGVDGIEIVDYKTNLEENIMDLLEELRTKTYTPTPVKRVNIPKKSGGTRPLGIPVIKDRIVQQATVNVLEPKFENDVFHKWSCGYRPNVGVERAMQIILWNLDQGYKYVYDADIKGFFDNIPHKRMMRVLNQYVADGTVLDMIWKWMKVGYLEEGKHLKNNSGTPQGGVISPLLANIYLNELDWDLEEAGIRFVRYADDFLLFAKSKEEVQTAANVAKKTLERLGLQIAKGKTKFVDFDKDDFDFLGFSFKHWKTTDEEGLHYEVLPSKVSIKDFKHKLKKRTVKTWTLSQEVWFNTVNPIIVGKTNYYMIPLKAQRANAMYGLKSNAKVTHERVYNMLDSFTRRRLRVCMIHRNPTVRKGVAMQTKWNNMYFHKSGLKSAHKMMMQEEKQWSDGRYFEYLRVNKKKKHHWSLKNAALKGKEYYTPKRVEKMRNAMKFCVT